MMNSQYETLDTIGVTHPDDPPTSPCPIRATLPPCTPTAGPTATPNADIEAGAAKTPALRPRPKGTKQTWPAELHAAWIAEAIVQHRLGKRVEPGGFKAEALRAIAVACERASPDGWYITNEQVKARLANVRKEYKEWKTVSEFSGMGWEPEQHVFTASAAVWAALDAAHPRLVKYRHREVLWVDELIELFEGRFATGERAIGIDDLVRDDERVIDPSLRTSQSQSQSRSQSQSQHDGELARLATDISDEGDTPLPIIDSVVDFVTSSSRKRSASTPLASLPKRERSNKGTGRELTEAFHIMNQESALMRELQLQSMKQDLPPAQRVLESIKTHYPQFTKLLNLKRTRALMAYLNEDMHDIGTTWAQFYLGAEDLDLPRDELIEEFAAQQGVDIMITRREDGYLEAEIWDRPEVSSSM
jgi:hypothetical protein